MHAPARRLLLAACPLALPCVALAQSAQPLINVRARQDAEAPPVTADRFILHDVVFFTPEPMALITDRGRDRPLAMFFRGDFGPRGCTLRGFTRDRVVVIDRRSGRELELKVATDHSTNGRTAPEWRNSEANPMRPSVITPPGLYESWSELSDDQKAELAAFYQRYGWKLSRADDIAGTLDIVWERVDATVHTAAVEAARAAFIKSLSPEQGALWREMQTYRSIYPVDGRLTARQQQTIAERQEFLARFQSTLTADQKSACAQLQELRSRNDSPRVTTRAPDLVLPQLLAAAATDPQVPTRYSKAWINSRANPMLSRPLDWPAQLHDQWHLLTAAERAQVVEYYRKHGWQLIYLETVSGATSASAWRNLFERDRIAVQKAKHDAFAASLSPALARIWRSGALSRTVYIANGQPDYARNRNPPEQQQVFAAFWAALNEQQKAAYANLPDFTTADWK